MSLNPDYYPLPDSGPNYSTGLRINFKGTKRLEPLSPLPAGTYIVTVADVQEGITSDDAKYPGQPKLDVTFSVDGGELDKRKIFKTYSFSDKALPFFLELCDATGIFTEAQLTGQVDLPPLDELADKLLRANVAIRIVQKRGMDGELRNEIKGVYPAHRTTGAKGGQ